MRSQNTQFLFQYWDKKRAGSAAPHRRDIEPADVQRVLPDMLILEEDDVRGEFVFRLTGSRFALGFGEDLKGVSFASQFPRQSGPLLQRLTHNCTQDGRVVVLGLRVTLANNRRLPYELLLLPLRSEDGDDRILGAASPLGTPFWIGSAALKHIEIQSVRVIDPDRDPLLLSNRPEITLPPQLAWDDDPSTGIRSKGPVLTVIDGGKSPAR